MKPFKPVITVALTLLVLGLAGCGPSKEELAARERARLELERQAQEDAAKANKAITDMNKKMFRQMNASRTGAGTPPEKREPEPAAPEKTKPRQP